MFWFEIDFNNLREDELGALLWSLRPREDFRHRLGMGKPLGLGSVRVDVAGLFLVDRLQRYAVDAIDAPRYQRAWIDPAWSRWPAERFGAETAVLQAGAAAAQKADVLMARARDAGLLHPQACEALVQTGRPGAAGSLAVHYPRLEGQGGEEKLFAWHMENANSRRRHEAAGLGPVRDGRLPTLKTLDKKSG